MRRTRRLTLEELAPYLWELPRAIPGQTPPPATPIDWQAVFGNANPVEVEVGCGKGLFLLNAAQQCPKINFFGIEIVRKYQLFTATRMAIRQLTNVRVACANARRLMQAFVPSESVQAIHVYFPDPWWKKRHHKRRVFTLDFVESCVRALKSGGQFHLATDVTEYFAVMVELCRQRPELESLSPPGLDGAEYLTNFERKAQLTGRAVSRGLFRKR